MDQSLEADLESGEAALDDDNAKESKGRLVRNINQVQGHRNLFISYVFVLHLWIFFRSK